jgi:hypothetical protein
MLFALRSSLLIGAAAVAASDDRLAAQVLPACTSGHWEAPFDHAPNAATPSSECDGHSNPWPATINAIHLSLIPKGSKRGRVLVFDHVEYLGSAAGVQRVHRWSILDPTASPPSFENFCMKLPVGKGDLFCAGHAWTAEGDLLVVGGTKCHNIPGSGCGPWEGSRLAYLWRPPTTSLSTDGGTWDAIQDLDLDRWYPTVTALGPRTTGVEDEMLITGGTHDEFPVDSYQVWVPPPKGTGGVGTWEAKGPSSNTFLGPSGGLPYTPPPEIRLRAYPRVVLLSADPTTGDRSRVAHVGMPEISSRLRHYSAPEIWSPQWTIPAAPFRHYGSTVLAPILLGASPYLVLNFGGKQFYSPQAILASVHRGDAGVASPTWEEIGPLAYQRWLLNTVLLPDTRVLVLGGERQYLGQGCSELPALYPEVFDGSQPPGGQRWRTMLAGTIIRDYHSTGLLLASGRVLTAGGEYRDYVPEAVCSNPPPFTSRKSTATDYEILQLDFVACGNPRPVILGTGGTGPSGEVYKYGSSYVVDYGGLPVGATIERVTLLRVGSVTHHADINQRCVELNFIHLDTGDLRVFMPTLASGILPRGYYMMFIVSSQTVVTQGLPSEAAWVKVE